MLGYNIKILSKLFTATSHSGKQQDLTQLT